MQAKWKGNSHTFPVLNGDSIVSNCILDKCSHILSKSIPVHQWDLSHKVEGLKLLVKYY
jgi:asparagine synthetase A